jgi:signal transduction histidine kinase
MLPNSKRPRINTAFRYWKDNRNPVDLISEREFFTPDDFQTADHRIKGEFDKFGNFTGTVEVYGELNSYVLSWRSENKTTDCGSFGINFAYLPGRRTDSRLPQEEYERIAVKCERIGGLYIYRDGIRILPYGDSDFDWLEVEKRRSKGAGYYYFSYRNMIGAIDISQSENKDLIEKAGREGFQENKGYREFRDILINFLIKVADKYFRKDSEHFQKREEMRRQEKAKREGEKLRREQRRKLANSLDKFFTQTQTNDLEKARQELLESLIKNLNAATQQLYPDDIKSSLNQSEVQARNRVNEIRSRIKVEIPPGVGLTDELEHDWLAYALEIDRLEKEYFQPLEGEIYERILEANRRAELEIDTKQRIERLINETTSESKTKISSEENAIRNEIDRIEKNVNSLLNDTRSDWNRIITGTEEKLRQLISNSSTMSNMEDQRHQLEREIIVKTDAVLDKLRRIRDQLIRIQWFQDEEGLLFGESEISAALETELLSIRNQFDTNLELAQLGMAIEVINHEFNQNVRNIRINLQGLKRWADLNPQLMPQYKDIRTSFEHLDAYLSLLTPLSRRLYRQATEITGIGIEEFLSNLFNDSLKKSGINLKVSKAFRDGKIFGYPSTFYPVFINLMDNSIYWLSIKQNSPREIYLDRQGDFFIFSDNGPGITSRDKDKIFEYGFSTKPSGRGLGLYIAKRVLEKEGFTLELINSPTGRGATFKIGPKN